MNANARPLTGRAILVTRPIEQAGGLAAHIAALGGTPVSFPALEIAPPSAPEKLAASLDRLRQYSVIFFVSPTAVERAWPLLLARHPDWPQGFQLAAVGQGSARALARFGAQDVLVPADGADSASLLRLPALQAMNGQRVLVVRGEGGRDELADTLRRRGAEVDYAECYRRRRPVADAAPLLASWRQGGIDAVTVTSAELLANLIAMLGPAGRERLAATPLFVLHERIAEAARAAGLTRVITTAPGEEGLIAGLVDWAARHD